MAYYLTVKKVLEGKIDDYTVEELKEIVDILKQYENEKAIEVSLKRAKTLKPMEGQGRKL